MKRFSDFADEDKPLGGDKIKIKRILGEEIKVLDYCVRQSKFDGSNSDRCLMLQVEHNGEKRVIFTGSSVLLEQAEKYSGEMPFLATIQKIDRYYTFT